MNESEFRQWVLKAQTEDWTNFVIKDQELRFLLSDIGSLSNLRELELRGCAITSLPPEIGNLIALKKLHLGKSENTSTEFYEYHLYRNNISELPYELGNLINLEELILDSNLIKSLPSSIGKLVKLKSIVLDNNKITNIPPEIRELKSLKSVDINHNSLSDLPPQIGNLSKLESLRAVSNNIRLLPDELCQLTELLELNLSDNQITSLPNNVGQLVNLSWLNLRGNKLKALPLSIRNLENLEEIDLRDNQLPIPPEILEKTDDPKSILNYYFSVVGQNKKQINEIKLLIVGQGSVGKTSIVQQMLYGIFDKYQTKTDGISISQWFDTNNSQIKINTWDFGGQEIMHATHQFFLTKRSLYLLVIDSRLTQEENRVEYWLKIIQSFGGESPVLIVGNKIDQHPLDIDRTGLQKKYPNIVGILETSAAAGTGIEELKSAITEQVNHLPHVRDLLPETWFTVKTKLEELGKQSNFITQEKYLDLCTENEVSDETSQRTLIGFLHDLGVVLHFQDDPRLEALGILNPQWVTNGVYKILNSHALFQNKGVLTVSMLDDIPNLPEYPRGKRLFIVDMMKKFELCYDIDPDKTFLVPDLLPKDQPDLIFNGIPAFEYAYPVLPSSLITRFIVRMNQKIDNGLVWRTGVVLKIGENKALVKADIEDRKITIAIDGLEHTRRDALSAIRFQLDEIHNSIKGLNPEKFVPIPGAESQRYDFLLQLEHDGVKMLPVPTKSGGKPIMVDVSQLLSGIESESQRRENVTHVTTVYHVNTGGGDFTGGDKSISAGDSSVVIGGNVSDSRISASYKKIESAEIAPELKQTLKSLTEAVTTVVQSFPEEKTTKVVKNFEKLVEEVTQPEPDPQWYSVSIEGLIKAAENLDKLGTPVISLSRKVLSLLTGGMVK